MRLTLQLTTVLLLVCMLTVPAVSAPRVRLGGVSAGFGYSSGARWFAPYPYYYGYRPWWALYDPFWSTPWLHSGLYRGFGHGPGMGQVKLNASKHASVYLNGAFAGTAAKLKSMWLEPGIYDLQVIGSNGQEYRRKVYVLSGKTLNVRTGAQ